jgi:hypothetical protein
MGKKNLLCLIALLLTFGSVQQPANAGLWDRVTGEVKHRRDQIKKSAIETHPYYLQLVVALQGAKKTKILTSNAECKRAINDTAAGIRTVINVSPIINAIGKEGGHRACNKVF